MFITTLNIDMSECAVNRGTYVGQFNVHILQ